VSEFQSNDIFPGGMFALADRMKAEADFPLNVARTTEHKSDTFYLYELSEMR